MNSDRRKVAFVTGASSGIGRASARMFAERGYAVMVADMNEAGGAETVDMIRRAGGTAEFVQCNVADDASAGAAVARAVETFGGLDAAFNAAGIDGDSGVLTADCSIENWNKVIAVNLTGVWNCMRHQIHAMLKSGGGAIVNCSSTAGIRGAAYCGVYSASKHGVTGMTKTAALEYASQGIRINAVCPGMIDTPMTNSPGMKPVIDQLVASSPTLRIGQPEEIAGAVMWLCSDDATYVHGQAIAVDGALTSR
ncbi:MAG: SDR family oxidoreductase [Novosphingobium sp.]|nr:SDR family oxidoreductase [Novosphingobium sp.]